MKKNRQVREQWKKNVVLCYWSAIIPGIFFYVTIAFYSFFTCSIFEFLVLTCFSLLDIGYLFIF